MTMPMSSPTRWEDALDEIEATVARSEELLVSVGEARSAPSGAEVWSPPCELPPMPQELRARALELLGRIAELERALADQASLTARQLGRVKRSDPRRRAEAGGYIDAES